MQKILGFQTEATNLSNKPYLDLLLILNMKFITTLNLEMVINQ